MVTADGGIHDVRITEDATYNKFYHLGEYILLACLLALVIGLYFVGCNCDCHCPVHH